MDTFKKILKGKVVFVGIGNVLRGDDAFGPALIEKLKAETDLTCIDAGSAPENYTGKIIKEDPDTVVIADAAHLDLKPGEYAFLKKEEIAKTGLTTHDLSPNLFLEFLEKETKAGIYMLAVQPENVSFGEEMSESIKNAISEITDKIKETKNA
ncbi:MAG: hydrogenase 3 maturation endopeptidase HyCI [Candidatus Omnitrophota bacterium]